LVFQIGEENYAVPLNQVKEVIAQTKITPVPHVPSYFKGLINLRGKVISTIDLKEKLGIGVRRDQSKRPCVVISELDDLVLGGIVDDVLEVVGVTEAQIERRLDIQSKVSREYIQGAVRFENRALTILLDFSRVLDVEELSQLRKSQAIGQTEKPAA
jgi:purine-binding chemotaxis protein CheW